MKKINLVICVLITLFMVQCQNSMDESTGESTKAEAIQEAEREATTQKLAAEQKTLAKVVTPKMNTMNGTWQSKNDAAVTIQITDNRFIEFQGAEEVRNAHFAFYNKCKGMGGVIDTAATDFIVVDEPEAESRCFYIEKLEGNTLHLTLASEGETVVYKRVK